jgi:hypothetical protein
MMTDCVMHYNHVETMLFLGQLLVALAIQKAGGPERNEREIEAIGWLRKVAYARYDGEQAQVNAKLAEDTLFALHADRAQYYGTAADMCDDERERYTLEVLPGAVQTADTRDGMLQHPAAAAAPTPPPSSVYRGTPGSLGRVVPYKL